MKVIVYVFILMVVRQKLVVLDQEKVIMVHMEKSRRIQALVGKLNVNI